MMRFLFIILFPFAASGQKKDTANYFILGKLPDFQLLYKAVTDPDNVTRKQVADLSMWLNNIKKILPDTTKLKK